MSRGTASCTPPANPLVAPRLTTNPVEAEEGERAGRPAEPSVMSSEVGEAKMREARREPNRDCKFCGGSLKLHINVHSPTRQHNNTHTCKHVNTSTHEDVNASMRKHVNSKHVNISSYQHVTM